MMAQSIILAKRPHLVVGTPGRLVDHLQNTKGFSVRGVKYLVLDEADKLLNMDFERELDIIVGACPRERNTFLFSATMTSKVKKLQRASLSNPVKVEVSSKYQASLASSVSLPHHVPSLSLTTFLSLSLQVALSLSPSLSLSHTAPLILRPPPFLRFSLCMPPPIYPICTFPYVLSHMYFPICTFPYVFTESSSSSQADREDARAAVRLHARQAQGLLPHIHPQRARRAHT